MSLGTISRTLSTRTSIAICLVFLGLACSAVQGRILAQERLLAPAEAANYQSGPTLYEPLMDFVYELESRTELMNVVKITETLGGRDVVMAILSNPPVFQKADLAYSDKPVVLIVNNVHGGETAGKEAAMEIMRDLVMGDLRPLLDDVVVLVVPTINPDGAEVRRRTNDEGFDMNRDYLKLETQEIQALVTKVLYDWRPDIFVDTHHGGSAPYALTFQTNMNPAGDENIMRLGNEEIIPAIRAALQAEDYDGFWYSGSRQMPNGEIGWAPTSVEPRKQHVYGTLANTWDSSSRPPAEVIGSWMGGQGSFRFPMKSATGIRSGVNTSASGNSSGSLQQIPRRSGLSWPKPGPTPSPGGITIQTTTSSPSPMSRWRSSGSNSGTGPEVGVLVPAESPFELVEGPILTKWQPTETVTRPWGYLIPNHWPRWFPSFSSTTSR